MFASEELFASGDLFFESMLKDIHTAKKHIYVESYIFDPGVLAERLLLALKSARHRGLNIKILVDGYGALEFIDNFGESLKDEGIPYKLYHPMPWVSSHIRESEAWLPSRIFDLWGNLNSRNHRKMVVIDAHIAYISSMNISDSHLAEVYGRNAWLDCGVKVVGSCVEALDSAFFKAWEGWRGKVKKIAWAGVKRTPAKLKINRFFILNNTVATRKLSFARLRFRIRKARERVWVMTPYFSPGVRFLRRLKQAAKRGVDVRVIFPKHNDVIVMDWLMKSYYAALLREGVRIFEYEPSVLHAKTILVDDWGIVGSSNLNSRSIVHDLELNYVLQMHSTRDHLATIMEEAMEKSIEVTSAKYVNFLQRFFGRIFLLVRYFL